MSKTLIVSDNEILNQLYLTNLEVYLATQVTVVLSTQKAQESIDEGEIYDLIITMNMINGMDSAVTLYEFLEKENYTIPLIVIGNPAKEIPKIIVVQSSYNLKIFLRLCAEVLGVTSQSMAALVIPDYYLIDTKFLMRLRIAPCPIFFQIKKSDDDNNFVMIAKKDSIVTEVLKKFASEGIESLYVNKMDRLLVINEISKTICDFIKSTEHLGPEEKSKGIEEGFNFVASDFCQSPEAIQEVMDIVNVCTHMMAEVTKEAPGFRSLLQMLVKNKNGYIYTHSILASFVASHIIKKVPWGGEGHLEKINFVLFFHDIMLAPIYLKHSTLKYEEDLLFSDILNDDEKEKVLSHARMAAELVLTYRKAPLGADLLIKQHHGMTNGTGFANVFKDDISPLSKIVLIAESFVEEYMKGKDDDPNFQIDLKKIIPLLIEKFKKNSYVKVIETLETIHL